MRNLNVHIPALLAVAVLVSVAGCSKLQQQASFEPIPQPRPLSSSEKQSVENVLQRQEEAREIAARRAAVETAAAESEAAKVAMAESENADPQSEFSVDQDRNMDVEQAANFSVAQVSFETEVEEPEKDQPETTTETSDPTPVVKFDEFVSETATEAPIDDVSTTASKDNITLTANFDDLEGIPFNIARDDFDLSQANFLRPSSNADIAQESPSESEPVVDNAAPTPQPFEISSSLQLPLQPMLFNPDTRSKKTVVEGTLRPLRTAKQEPEPKVEVEKSENRLVADVSATDSNFTPQALTPLNPLKNPNTIRLASRDETPSTDTFASRLLEPIKSTVEEFAEEIGAEKPVIEDAVFETPKTDATPEVVATETTAPMVAPIEYNPVMVSEEIFVVDPEPKTVAATATATPAVPKPLPETEPVPVEVYEEPQRVPQYEGPVVDESLSGASASYLKPAKPLIKVKQEAFIPAEVIEDAKAVAEDVQRELEATSIPTVEAFPVENNDFKVLPTSTTQPAPVMTPAPPMVTATAPATPTPTTMPSNCSYCDSEDCKGGCQFKEIDPGEPMFENNDFAQPESPGGAFIPPMTVVPAEVPVATPAPINTTHSEFGGQANFDAPPESDSMIARVASLPVPGESSLPATSSKVPPVGVSTLMELNTVTWKSRLDEAIELAEERLNRINNPSDSSLVNLRLLKALRGQMEQMESSNSNQHSENESQYWQHQLEAITEMLGSPTGTSQAVTDYHRHQTAHKTLEHLRNAVSQLESIASLKVNSGQFCTEITGFGQFRTFASNDFSPGQKMLVYCEVENYRTVENQTATGLDYRTRLKGSFAIYDANGKVVQQAEYPTVEDIARKRRRDFYMYLPVTLGDLPSGQYVLHALVEDVYGNKTASLDPPLQFNVK